MDTYDYVVVGGGVVGCAVFRALSGYKCRVALVEAANDVGTGASCANSGIVHAGYDCPIGSLKGRLNVEGSKLFPEFCRTLGVPFRRTGSLVVGDASSYTRLNSLLEQGRRAGVPGLRIVQKGALRALEPNLAAGLEVGLYAELAGVCASYSLSVALAQCGILNGGKVYLNYPAHVTERLRDGYVLEGGAERLRAKWLVNCAGAHFAEVNREAGAEAYPVSYRRGEYYVLDKSQAGLVSHAVFPLPSAAGKGILVSPTTSGNVLVGPNSEPAERPSRETTASGMERVREGAEKLVRGIDFKRVIKRYAGVRTLSGQDFVIEKSRLAPNFITVGGICSPGLTASPAIAGYVLGLLPAMPKKEKPAVYQPLPAPQSETDLNALIRCDPDFGVLVCKCEKVSLGQLKYVMSQPLPPADVNGLRRRLRVTMGRCQGAFCSPALTDFLRKHGGGAC